MFKIVKEYEALCNEFGLEAHLWIKYRDTYNTISYFDGYAVVGDPNKVGGGVVVCENVTEIENFTVATLHGLRKFNKKYYEEKLSFESEIHTMYDKLTEGVACSEFFKLYGKGVTGDCLVFCNKAKIGRDKIKMLVPDARLGRDLRCSVGYKGAMETLYTHILSEPDNRK